MFNKEKAKHPLGPAPKGGKISKDWYQLCGFHTGRKQEPSLSVNPGIPGLHFGLFKGLAGPH